MPAAYPEYPVGQEAILNGSLFTLLPIYFQALCIDPMRIQSRRLPPLHGPSTGIYYTQREPGRRPGPLLLRDNVLRRLLQAERFQREAITGLPRIKNYCAWQKNLLIKSRPCCRANMKLKQARYVIRVQATSVIPAKCVAFILSAVHLAIASLVLYPAAMQAQSSTPWTNLFKGPTTSADTAFALTVDAAGDVIVGGQSGQVGFEDFAVVKYSSAGTPLWTNFYNGPGNSTDRIEDVAVDSGGNVAVTGYSRSTASSGSEDFTTIRYSSTGVPLWTNRYDGPAGGYDVAVATVIDLSSNIVVAGTARTTTNFDGMDFTTVKYSSAGVPLWTRHYNGPGNSEDQVISMAMDTNGSVFVVGYVTGVSFNTEFATVAYSSAGVPLWTNLHNGPGGGSAAARAVAVDRAGDVVVTGNSSGVGTSADFVTIKYSGTGVPLWTNRYNGPGNASDRAYGVAVDSNANVFVTGFSTGSADDHDYATLKYSSAGTPLWINRYDGPGHDDDDAAAIVVDNGGNVVITGTSTGSGGFDDYATVAYSNAGIPLRTNRYNGPGNSGDTGEDIAVDAIGNVIVTGSVDGGGSGEDFGTIKYTSLSPAGTLLPIPLNLQKVGGQVVLTWTNAAFNLQSAPVVTGTYTNIPGATSPTTNPVTGPQQFFRLRSN